MIATRHQPMGAFTAHDIVRLKRRLVTDGRHAHCPRCDTGLSVVVSIDDRSMGRCDVSCTSCGGQMAVPDFAREFLLS